MKSLLLRAIIGLGSMITFLFAGCVAQPQEAIPTQQLLPTVTTTPQPTQSDTPTDIPTILPSDTPSLTPTPEVIIWYAAPDTEDDLIFVYDCADIACGVIAAFEDDQPVEVIQTDEDWHTVVLEDESIAFVEVGDLRLAMTASPSPSPTASATPSATATHTVTATRTPTGTRMTPTYTWTFGAPITGVPTLPLVGPSIIGGGSSGMPLDSTAQAATSGALPTSPRIQPPVAPTWTPSRTPSPTRTHTLSAPPPVSTQPPQIDPTDVILPPTGGPPPTSEPVATNPQAPPGGGSTPPGAGATATIGGPPPPPGPPPGA